MKRILILISALFCISILNAQQNDPELMSLVNEKDPAALKQKIETLINSKVENNYILLSTYYRVKRDDLKRDSINNIALKLFPKGQLASSLIIEKLYFETDVAKKEALLAKYKADFPIGDLESAYSGMVYTMAKDQSTFTDAIKYYNLLKEKSSRTTMGYHLGVNMAIKDPKLAESFIPGFLEEFKEIETSNGASVQDQQNKTIYGETKFAYGKILFDKNEFKNAQLYFESFFNSGLRGDIDKKIIYSRNCIKLGDFQKAFPLLDELVKSGKGNAQLNEELALVYNKLNPGGKGSEYVAGLTKEMQKKISDEFLKEAINTPAPAFTIIDVNGIEVKLSDFKGKTIVLDFWATWCGPCKKSFPAMQLAVNKYKNDPNVKFLFIHTWETSKTPLKDAQTYLKENNYSFDLYIDPKADKPNTNKTANLFGFRGIPQKYIIDSNGNIRFNVEGFGGGDDAAVEELTNMIEFAKKAMAK